MYTPRTISAEVPAEIELLAGKLRDHRVTFLLGAGFSHGEPSMLPLAGQLSAQIYTAFSAGFAATQLATVEPNNLLAVADAIALADPPNATGTLQHYVAANVPFDSAIPNHAHRTLAALFAEQLVSEAMTTNYDTCIERAAITLEEPCIASCRLPADLQQGGPKARLLKLHGCVSNVGTMLLTSSQLNAPDEWVLASVIDATAKETLVIIGINSVAPYVEATLHKVWQYAEKAQSIWIVSPEIDDVSWDALIGADNDAHKLHMTGEEFLDQLLHACILDKLTMLRQMALDLDAQQAPAADGDANSALAADLIESLKDTSVLALHIALRAGVMARQTPVPIVAGDIGLKMLYGLALLQHAVETRVAIQPLGNKVWVKLDKTIVNFAHGRGATTGASLAASTEVSLRHSKAQGLLPNDSRILALASGFNGPLPTKTLPLDIVGDPGSTNIIDGPDRMEIAWIALDDLTSKKVSNARELVRNALS